MTLKLPYPTVYAPNFTDEAVQRNFETVALEWNRLYYNAVETSQTRTSTSYGDLTTVGPTFTVPTNGSYMVRFGATIEGAAQDRHYAAIKVGTAATADAEAVSFAVGNPAGQSQGGSVGRSLLVSGLTAGDVLLMQYRTTLGSTGTFYKRWMEVVPLG